uniref:TF-B3 domain-containing protein n=1 Tax=Solanum tuberosum TaxID=4113 RepID=M1CFK4_SOLTU
MVKNQQASIYDEGSKRKRPEKYPYTSKFPKQTLANGENDTEHATPRKRAALEKEEDLLTDLTPNIPQFVKCLKGYNVKMSCFLGTDDIQLVIPFLLDSLVQMKNGAKCDNKEEEVNVENRKSIEPKEKNKTRDNKNSSFDDDSTDNYMVEEEEDNDEEEVEKEEEEDNEQEGEEKETEEEVDEGKEDETEEEVVERKENETEEQKDEEENEMTDTFKKKTSGSKDGCRKAITCKVRNVHDKYGADIFRSGRTTQPKNPYFVAKIRAKMRNQLYVPIDVVRDYELKLHPTMIIRDSVGREFETKVNNWSNGTIWLVGGWRNLCRWNLVEKDDRCICEFVREKCGKILYLQVQVLYEGSNSHHNNK